MTCGALGRSLTSVVRQKFHDIRGRCSLRRFVDLAAVRFPTSGIRSGGDGGAVGKIWGVVQMLTGGHCVARCQIQASGQQV
jgi:hypothetical protein